MLQGKNGQETYTKSLISVGSNLSSTAGDVQATVLVALELLAAEAVTITAQSRLFRTPAFPPGAGPDFVNAALEVTTALSPEALLAVLHGVEKRLGRTRKTRWEARILDLDLLAYGAEILPDRGVYDHWLNLSPEAQRSAAPSELVLPHPRLQDRAFVLIPLMDIAPNWRHPCLGKTIAELATALPAPDVADIVPLQ